MSDMQHTQLVVHRPEVHTCIQGRRRVLLDRRNSATDLDNVLRRRYARWGGQGRQAG